MPSEFEFIESIRPRSLSSSIKTGIGDDCAVISKDAKTDLIITTDLLVEDIDFRLNWTQPEFLGHKALAVSLSDVAAMGGKPVWAMLSIGIPQKIWKTDFVERFYSGWFSLAEKFGIILVGGDVSQTPDKVVIDSIAAGEVKKNKAVLRSTSKPGDLIFVTGSLGGAARGLELLEKGEKLGSVSKPSKPKDKLLLRQLRPHPHIEIGQILSAKDLATSMIDLSDGLSSDLAHLCRESRTGAKIFANKIPVEDNLQKIRKQKSGDSLGHSDLKNEISNEMNYALNGGEDFELLFTVSPKKISALENALKTFRFSHIGEITENVDTIEVIGSNESRLLTPQGFRHF